MPYIFVNVKINTTISDFITIAANEMITMATVFFLVNLSQNGYGPF